MALVVYSSRRTSGSNPNMGMISSQFARQLRTTVGWLPPQSRSNSSKRSAACLDAAGLVDRLHVVGHAATVLPGAQVETVPHQVHDVMSHTT